VNESKHFAVYDDSYAGKEYGRVTTSTQVSEPYLLQVLLNVLVTFYM
jgi:hypothetical protein